MFSVWTLGFLLGISVPFCEAYSPWVEVRINKAAVDYVTELVRTSYQDALKLRLPDFLDPRESSLSIPVFILDNYISHFYLKFIPNHGIRLSATGQVNMTFIIDQKFQRLGVDINITANVIITQGITGSPLVGISVCKGEIGAFSQINGDELKELLTPIDQYIRILLPDKLCSKLIYLTEGLNVFLSAMIGVQALGPETQISYSLAQLPTITKEYISLKFKVMFYLLGKLVDLPQLANSPSLPQQVGSRDAMVDFVFTTEVLDSIYFLMQKSGSINLDFTSQLNSENNQLITSVLGNLIPEVQRQFPNSMPITMKARISTSPISLIHSNQTSLLLNYLVEALAISSNSDFKSIFSLNMDVEMKLNFSMYGKKLKANVSFLKDIEFKVNSSNVGHFDLSTVKPLLVSVVKKPLKDHLNVLFGLGAALPAINKVNFTTPEVFMYEGFVAASCGLQIQN